MTQAIYDMNGYHQQTDEMANVSHLTSPGFLNKLFQTLFFFWNGNKLCNFGFLSVWVISRSVAGKGWRYFQMEAEDSPKTGKVMKITLLGSGATHCPCLYVFLPEWQLATGFQMAGWKSWGLIAASNKLNECYSSCHWMYPLHTQTTPAKIWATIGTGFNYARHPIFIGRAWNKDSPACLELVLHPFCNTITSLVSSAPCSPHCPRQHSTAHRLGQGTAMATRLKQERWWMGGSCSEQSCSPCNCPGITGDSPT